MILCFMHGCSVGEGWRGQFFPSKGWRKNDSNSASCMAVEWGGAARGYFLQANCLLFCNKMVGAKKENGKNVLELGRF